MTSIRVGFEVPTGREVRIEPHHVGVTGLTQRSGKTTLLEALMDRANETAIAFRTSRGEIGFRGAKRIAPYFRPRTDWRFVEGLISAHLMEKAKFYRADLIRLTRGTKTLADVHANVKAALAKARPGSWPEKILTELNEYLTEIREALDQVPFATAPNLTPMALSVMDLEGLKPAIQQLVIAATVDWLMEGHLTVPVVVVLPEARDFIPEDRRTPAKLALEDLIRKGARVQRYLWLDSQALTGLDMDVCRSIGTWFFGRQTLDIECRVARMIPGKRVKPDDVRPRPRPVLPRPGRGGHPGLRAAGPAAGGVRVRCSDREDRVMPSRRSKDLSRNEGGGRGRRRNERNTRTGSKGSKLIGRRDGKPCTGSANHRTPSSPQEGGPTGPRRTRRPPPTMRSSESTAPADTGSRRSRPPPPSTLRPPRRPESGEAVNSKTAVTDFDPSAWFSTRERIDLHVMNTQVREAVEILLQELDDSLQLHQPPGMQS